MAHVGSTTGVHMHQTGIVRATASEVPNHDPVKAMR